MSINFDLNRWESIRNNYSLWWEHKLARPLIPVLLEGRDPGRNQPATPLLSQKTCNDLIVPAKDLIDRIDFELSRYEYLGDSFPFVNLDCFGPGIVSAFLGAELDNSTGRVWFHPNRILPIDELHFVYDSNNVWLNRIKEICYEGMRRWQGQVLIGMPDLGGVLDILAVFRQTDNLLMDLYDDPEEVQRLVWEIHNLWHRYYNEINEVLQPINPGYSDWSKIYSDKPSYIPQSDFCYMVSPSMFDNFAKPELEVTCRKLDRTIYHLDGVGQLPHLDSILKINELDAVQWVAGDGKLKQHEWPEVQKKIQDAGKGIQIGEGFEGLNSLSHYLGSGKDIHCSFIGGHIKDKIAYIEKLKSYGIE